MIRRSQNPNCISTNAAQMQTNTALIGRSTNTAMFPRDNIKALRKFSSTIGPRT
ncbi:TPA: hypothetical protein QDB24_006410 [Burkholderia vietnamiensis]|nr:hypothetical protein [Burkholderia vietnamiensis]